MAATAMGFSVGAIDRASGAFAKVADAVDGLVTKLRRLDRTTASPTLDVDDKPLRAKIAAAEKKVADLKRRVEQDTPQLDLDIRAAEAKQKKLTSDLQRLRGLKVTPEVELKIAQAEAQLGRVNSQLETLRGKKVTPEVRANLAAAEAELAGFNAQLSELDRRRVNVKVDADVDGATRKVQVLDKSFGAATIRAAALARAMSTIALPAAIVAATPYVASLGHAAVQAAGSLWLLPAAATAGGIAFAGLKVGLAGFGDAMSNMDDPEKFAEAVAKLSPAAASAANAVRGLVPAWTSLQQSVQQNLFAGVAGEIQRLAGSWLPLLRTGLSGTAAAFNQFAMNFAAFAGAPQTLADMPVLFNNTNAALRILSPIVNNLLGTFRDIAVVGSGFLPQLAQGAVNATQQFQTFVHTARQTGQLAVWIQNGIDTINQLGRIVRNTGALLGGLFAAGAASGESFLDILERVTGSLNNAIRTPEGAAAVTGFFVSIREIVGIFIDKIVTLWPAIQAGAAAFAALLSAAAPVANVLLGMVVSALVPMLNAIQWLAPVLGPLAVGFLAVNVATGAAAAAMSAWTVISKTAGVVAGVWNALLHPIATATKAWAIAQGALNAVMAMNPISLIVIGLAALVAAIVLAWNHSETFRNVVIGAWEAIKNAASAVFGWLVNFFPSVWASIVSTATAAWDGLVSFITGIGPAIAAAATAAWNWLVTATQTAIDATINFVTTLPNRIAFALGALAGFLLRAAIDGWAAFTTGLNTAWVNTIAWFAALPTKIGMFLTGLAADLAMFAVTAWNGFTQGLNTAWVNTIAWFVALPSKISAFFTNLAVSFATFAITAWNGFTTGLNNGWAATIAWFVALPAKIGAFFTNAGTWLLQTGLDLVAGLIMGVTNAWNGLWGWIGGLIQSFIDGFKAGFGIASPSTIFAEIGGFLIQGLIQGIQTAAAFLWTIITTIAQGVVNFFMAGIQGLAAMWSAVWNGIVLVFQTVWATIQAVAAVAWAAVQNVIMVGVQLFQVVWQTVWNGVMAIFQTVWAAIQMVAQTAWALVSGVFSVGMAALQVVFQTVWNAIVAIFQVTWNTIQSVAMTVWNAISSFFSLAFATFQALFTGVWNLIVAIFTGNWQAMQAAAVSIWNAISGFFTGAFAIFTAMFQNIWNTISAFFSTVWSIIQATAMTVWNAISAFFSAAFAAFQAFFQTVWNAISLIFTTVWNLILTTAQTIWNTIATFFTTAFEVFTTFFQTIWNNIVAIFQVVWDLIVTTAQTMWGQIAAFFEGAWATFTSFFQTTWDNIVGIFDRVWSSVIDIASRVWEGVKNAFIDGINWVIRKINSFADAINRVAGLLGFDINLGIAEIPRQAGGPILARRNGGPIGLAAGGGVNAAGGGMLPGRNKPGRDRLPAVAGAQHYRLDGGEYVVTRDSTKAIGAAGMAAINNAKRDPVDIVPRRKGGVTHLANGGPVLPETVVRNHMPFLSALKDGQAEAVQAANVHGGRDRFLTALADGDKKAEKAAGKPRQRMDGYRTQYHPSQLRPIHRDLGGAIAFAKSMHGRPYIWGGTTTAGTDCSGYQGMITRVLRNQAPARIGSTHDFPWPGFVNGLGSAYSVGSFKGNPGHMAGTLAGVNVESGGSPSMVKYGVGAAGADSGQFGIRAHLPEAGGVFASGGGGGGGGLSFGALARSWLDPLYRILVPIRDNHAEGLANRSGAGGGVWLMDKIVAAADALGGGGGAGSAGLPVGGPAVDAVRAVANRYGWGSGPEWDAISFIVHNESGWDPNAANPNSSARGLFQKMTSIHGPVEPTAAGQAEWGLNYIRGRYGTPTAARRFWEANKHYDQGGLAVGTGMMMKDVITPERVLSSRQTRSFEQLVAALTSGRPQQVVANGAALSQLAATHNTRTGRGVAVTVDNSDTVAELSRLRTEVSHLQTVIKEARAVNVYARNDDTAETGRAVALQMRL